MRMHEYLKSLYVQKPQLVVLNVTIPNFFPEVIRLSYFVFQTNQTKDDLGISEIRRLK